MKKYDVVIVGAGIIGLSVAWQIARRSALRVAVLEKAPAVAEGSTGASSAVCRFRYSIDEVVFLARDGINAYRHWREFTGLNEPRASFVNDGVLWMPGDNLEWADREHARMQKLGIATEVLDASDMAARFPGVNACVLAPDFESGEEHECRPGGRNFFEADGGYIDPVATTEDLAEACRGRGVDLRLKTRVASIDTVGGAVTGVTLEDGETIATPLLVNAAGPWCREFYRDAGVELKWDLVPTRIQVLYRDRPEELAGHIPVSVDMQGGIYFRTQNRGQQLVIGSVLEEDEKEAVADPDHFAKEADDDFQLLKLHALHHRLPALPYRGKVRGYCGLYTVNRNDVHPILGQTAIEGFWVANGFSGHGFKLAPAIGSMVARAITGEASDFDTEVPIEFLSIDREPIVLDSKSVLA